MVYVVKVVNIMCFCKNLGGGGGGAHPAGLYADKPLMCETKGPKGEEAMQLP